MSEKYYHWIWGENILRDDEPNYLINLEIGVSIRFDFAAGYMIDFETFFDSIADVQFFLELAPGKRSLNPY